MPGQSGAGGLGAFHVQIDDDRILTAAHHDSLAGLVLPRVDLLMRNVRRDVNEIAGAGLVGKFEMIAPAHAGPPFDDVEDGFELAVVVRPGFRVGLHHYRSCPEFAGSGSRMRDGGGTAHAGSLWRIRIELSGAHDLNAMIPPVRRIGDIPRLCLRSAYGAK